MIILFKGIDVSRWQGSINWDSVKQTDVEFVILKAGGSDAGLYVDPTFEHNYKECKRLGIPVGCYYFVGSKCTSGTDGLADLEVSLDLGTTDATKTITNGIKLNQWQIVTVGYTDDGDDEITIYINAYDSS